MEAQAQGSQRQTRQTLKGIKIKINKIVSEPSRIPHRIKKKTLLDISSLEDESR
jgi:hypothetical protein